MGYSASDEGYLSLAPDLRTLPNIKACGQPLSLEIDYLPTWTFRYCFREVCQNWFVPITAKNSQTDKIYNRVDGIRDTNNLQSRIFFTEIEDTNMQWLARALHPDIKVLLGFIRFSKRRV
jgi:hypothetical protein